MRMTLMAAAAVSILAFGAQAALAEESCTGSGMPLPQSQIEAQLKAQGYTQIREIKTHGGCYEAKGLDSAGKRFELEVNAYNGQINNQEQ